MKASLLIADRDSGLVDAVRRCLVARGYEVSTAVNALECHDLLLRTSPTILVLDPELLWGGGDGILDWLVTEEPLMPPMVVITDAPPTGRLIPDHLEPWIDLRIQRPTCLDDLLTYVHQLESLAWWSQSPTRTAAVQGTVTSPRTVIH